MMHKITRFDTARTDRGPVFLDVSVREPKYF